jgi:hypothetical protein
MKYLKVIAIPAMAIALLGIMAVSTAQAAGDGAEWTFAASGTAAKVDVTGNGHNLGTDWQGVSWSSDAPAGLPGSLALTGAQDWLDTWWGGGASQYTTLDMSSWPIEHVKFSLKFSTAGNGVIIDQDAVNGYFYHEGSFRTVVSGGAVQFNWNEYGTITGVSSAGTYVHYAVRQFTGSNDGQWHTYEADLDPTQANPSNRLSFYKDGVLSTDNNGYTDPTGAAAAFANTTLEIGGAADEPDGYTYHPLVGSVADVAIWGSTPAPVPEPSSMLLLLPGAAGLLGLAVRRRSSS